MYALNREAPPDCQEPAAGVFLAGWRGFCLFFRVYFSWAAAPSALPRAALELRHRARCQAALYHVVGSEEPQRVATVGDERALLLRRGYSSAERGSSGAVQLECRCEMINQLLV